METFLPFPSISETVAVLRQSELIEARSNAIKILNIRHEVANFDLEIYRKHPVVLMWVNHEPFLIEYAMQLGEAIHGKVNQRTADTLSWHLELCTSGDYTLLPPQWFGDIDFHRSHQSMLIRKDPFHYSALFPNVSMIIPPFWPHRNDA